MTTPNKHHQSGNATAYLKDDWATSGMELYVRLSDNCCATFDKGNIIMQQWTPGQTYGRDDVCLAWHITMEDNVIDMFKAIGKALDIYSDEPSQAYKQGYAEGEAKVLREWNESLRCSTNGPVPASPEQTYQQIPMPLDWSKP